MAEYSLATNETTLFSAFANTRTTTCSPFIRVTSTDGTIMGMTGNFVVSVLGQFLGGTITSMVHRQALAASVVDLIS